MYNRYLGNDDFRSLKLHDNLTGCVVNVGFDQVLHAEEKPLESDKYPIERARDAEKNKIKYKITKIVGISTKQNEGLLIIP